MAGIVIEWAVYRRVDGNVFDWILQAAQVRRQLKKRERDLAIAKAAEKSESVDNPKVENQKW